MELPRFARNTVKNYRANRSLQYILQKNKQSPHIIQVDIEKDIGLSIGKDAIYDFIYRYKLEWIKYLKRKHKWRKKMKKNNTKKTLIPNRINISERPFEAKYK